jgi:hypothetical protein
MRPHLLIPISLVCSCITAFGVTRYVDVNGTNPTPPYTNWATAATVIQDAVDACASGDFVIVADGVYVEGGRPASGYNTSNRVVISLPVTVHSVNGPAGAVIVGQGPRGNYAVRCAHLSGGAVLMGFTCSNGSTRTFGYADEEGGGVYLTDSTVSNCVVSDCVAGDGAGIMCTEGVVADTIVSNNSTYQNTCGGVYSVSSTVVRCVVCQNRAQYGGGGVNAIGGYIGDCHVYGNQAGYYSSYGGGIRANYGALVERCRINANRTEGYGGGVSLHGQSLARDCVVYDNLTRYYGGGIYVSDSMFINCTVIRNKAEYYAGARGGGVACEYAGTGVNSIVYFNTATTQSSSNWNIRNGGLVRCNTAPLPGDGSNTNVNPQLVDLAAPDLHLLSTSPLIDAGSNGWNAGILDCDRLPRVMGAGIDIGAYEQSRSAVLKAPAIIAPVMVAPGEGGSHVTADVMHVTITGTKPVDHWVIRRGQGGGFDTNGIVQEFAGTTWTHTVMLDPQDGSRRTPAYKCRANDPAIASQDTTKLDLYTLYTPVHYVALDGGHVWPYTNWADAAQDIQSAVDAAVSFDLVLVQTGLYATGGLPTPGQTLTSRVVVAKMITVEAVAGPDDTVIMGEGPIGPDAIRGVYLSHGAMLRGFLVSNGHTHALSSTDATDSQSSSGSESEYRGGGVFIDGAGVVEECFVAENKAVQYGGGIYCHYGGTVVWCRVHANRSEQYGGGISCYFGGHIKDTEVSDNRAQYDGYGGSTYGGGIHLYRGAIAEHCRVGGNGARATDDGYAYGGGIYADYSIINRCMVQWNHTEAPNDSEGGGINSWYTDIYNCDVAFNSANGDNATGGGLHFGSAEAINCTVARNYARNRGGGIYAGRETTNRNCIVYHNVCEDNPDTSNWYAGVYLYSCTLPDTSGIMVITNDPRFVSDDQFFLRTSSPCVDSGSNTFAYGPYDLPGAPRILGGTVNMGAYEQTFDDVLPGPAITVPAVVPPGESGEYVCTNVPDLWIVGTKSNGTYVAWETEFMVWSTNDIVQELAATVWSNWVELEMDVEGCDQSFQYVGCDEYIGAFSTQATEITIYDFLDQAPTVGSNALIFPSAGSELVAPAPTNVTWYISRIIDDHDGSNLTLTAITVHLADTTGMVAVVTNMVPNVLGQLTWMVPDTLIDVQATYLMQFVAMDSGGRTGMCLFVDNPFTVVPEPLLAAILLAVPLLAAGRRQ